MSPTAWVPPVVWMGVILALSSEAASAAETGRILLPLLGWLLPWASPADLETAHGILRKLAHPAEYALLGALWLRAFVRGRAWPRASAAWAALAVSVGWALVDEGHQALVASRTASLGDVAIDAAGATAAVTLWRPRRRRVTGAASPGEDGAASRGPAADKRAGDRP